MRTKTWVGAAITVIATAVLVALLWPVEDPLGNVTTVAIQLPDWERADPRHVARVPFMDGLTVTLNRRNVRIVADAQTADAVLVVRDVRVDELELRLDSGRLAGRLSATCLLTELPTNRERVMDFTLEIENGNLHARLTPRRWWQFWKRS